MNKGIPYIETHLATSVLIVDIQFENGGYIRGHLCRSFSYENGSLVLYKDIDHKEREYIEHVKRLEVIGEVFGKQDKRMTVDKIIYEHLLCESRTIERAIYKLNVPGIINIDGTNISVHKVLSVFIAPQYSDGHWRLFMDLEYINNSGTYQHKRCEFDHFTIGG